MEVSQRDFRVRVEVGVGIARLRSAPARASLLSRYGRVSLEVVIGRVSRGLLGADITGQFGRVRSRVCARVEIPEAGEPG